MKVTINGEERSFSDGLMLETLLGELGIDPRKVAVERNLEIVSKSTYGETKIVDGDKLEVVHFIGGGMSQNTDTFEVAGRTFSSRLLVGTGKYKDFEETKLAIEASGAEIVTVAVRRVNVSDPSQPMLVDYVDPKKYTYLPNTAGCFDADTAVRTLRLAREHPLLDRIVRTEPETLLPLLTSDGGPAVPAMREVAEATLFERMPEFSEVARRRAADALTRLLVSYAVSAPDDPPDVVAETLATLLFDGLRAPSEI